MNKSKDYKQFSFKINTLILEKFGYISEYYGRTKNRQLQQLIKYHIESFEAEHGEITDIDLLKSGVEKID